MPRTRTRSKPGGSTGTGSLEIREVPIEDLEADPDNARSHGERNLDAIGASLARFGQVEPLVVRRVGRGPAFRVVGGNGRLEALRRLGATTARVVEVSLGDAEAAALALALNRTAELAGWDDSALTTRLDALVAEGDGLALATGFDLAEIEAILAPLRVPSGPGIEYEPPADGAPATLKVLSVVMTEEQRAAVLEEVDRAAASGRGGGSIGGGQNAAGNALWWLVCRRGRRGKGGGP
uniref:ParB-like N-terminal domain-containing protein n=1 Tax=viral metagenome TaxID=1070528 RepID=A0A6M3J8B8_9ZZZZ